MPVVGGVETSRSASGQEALSVALRKVFRRIDFARFSGKRVHLPGWLGNGYPDGLGKADSKSSHERYLSNLFIEGIVFAGGQVTMGPQDADLALLIRPEVLGAQTTNRVYRFQGYPIYVHDEDYYAVRVAILGYDYRTNEYFDIETGISYGTAIEPYILDVFGFKVYW